MQTIAKNYNKANTLQKSNLAFQQVAAFTQSEKNTQLYTMGEFKSCTFSYTMLKQLAILQGLQIKIHSCILSDMTYTTFVICLVIHGVW